VKLRTSSTVTLSIRAQSFVDVEVFDGRDDTHDPPSRAVFRDAYDRATGKIAVPDDDDAKRLALGDALTDLANDADEIATDTAKDFRERAFAKAARESFTNAAVSVYQRLRKR
jgi:hypothetical protein